MKGLYSALGCNVALLEYRGYGRSEGSPSEVWFEDQIFLWDPFHTIVVNVLFKFNLSQEGLCMDAQAALDYLHTREDIASDRYLKQYSTWTESGNTLFLKMNNVVCTRIIIFGRSLGGAVAVDLATRYLIDKCSHIA